MNAFLRMKKLANSIAFKLILTFIITYGVGYMLKGAVNLYTITNSVFSVPLFALIGVLVWKTRIYSPRFWKCVLPVSIFFAMSLVIGSNILTTGFSRINHGSTWAAIVSGTLFWEYMANFLAAKIKPLTAFVNYEPVFLINIKTHLKSHYFLKCWSLILLAWIPVWIATYPGIYGYDSIYQVMDYAKGTINTHHPWIHTYILGFCIYTVGNYLGNIKYGMAIYCVGQMVILSGCFAFIMALLRKIPIPGYLEMIILAYFMFMPTNPLMAISSTKDIPFAAFFIILWGCCIVFAKNGGIGSLRGWMIAFVMIVLCFIFRNNGIYVVIGTLLSGIILFKWKNKFKFLILLIISTLAFGLYTGPLRNWAGVEKEPNGIREAMSIPCVQLSRVATYNKKVTTEEIKEIKKYIPAYYTYSKNQQGISDIMKNSFNYKLFMKKPGEFALLWGKLGLKYPVTYFDAAARLSIGLWYPDMNERDSQAYHPYWEYDPDSNIDRSKWIFVERANPAWTNSIANFYRHLTYQNSYQRYPLVRQYG